MKDHEVPVGPLVQDIAVLSSLSVATHYLFGLYGLVVAVLVVATAEHGERLWRRFTTSLHVNSYLPTSCLFDTDDIKCTQQEDDATASESSHQEDTLSSQVSTESVLTSGLLEDVGPLLSQGDLLSEYGLDQMLVRDLSSTATCRLMQVNSHLPIPFENDLFAGHVFIFTRTSSKDSTWAHLFENRQRCFWIQVQGKFKRSPKGTVFLGGELPSRISPGIFTRSIAHLVMRIVNKLVGRAILSFGDAADTQRPGIVFPLYQSVDQFVMTPEGVEPPSLGTRSFGETDNARRKRHETPVGQERFVVGPTYSFDFHTMYADLAKWKTANLPGIGDLSLSDLFDNLPLRLVAYDLASDATMEDRHLQKEKEYLFSFEVKHQPPASPDTTPLGSRRNSMTSRRDRTESDDSALGSASSTAVDSNYPLSTNVSDGSSLDGPNALESYSGLDAHACARHFDALRVSLAFWLEEIQLSSGLRRVHYVFNIRSEEGGWLAAVSAYDMRQLFHASKSWMRGAAREDVENMRFHCQSRSGSYSTISEEAQVVHRCMCSIDAMADTSREQVVALKAALYELLTSRQRLQPADSTNATCTPSRLGVNMSQRDRQDLGVSFEGVVYRFHTEEILRQEVLFVTPQELLFYRTYSTDATKRVSVDRVIGVQEIEMPYSQTHEQGFSYALQVSTFGEEIVLCLGTDKARSTWMRVLSQHCRPQENLDRCMTEEMVVCYTASPCVRPARRVVLNSRSLFPPALKVSPTEQVERALRRGLHIHTADQISVLDILDFLNEASGLRSMDLDAFHQTASHEDKIAFYLNLYHVVLVHAMISHGFPRSKRQWGFFLQHMCYAVGCGDGRQLTLSLAEIEHAILRARMPPAQLPHLSKLPENGLSSRFGLGHPDFRLSFALLMNQDGVEDVVVFDPTRVHEQLNAVVQKSLEGAIELDASKHLITLPRVCEWYRQDFGGQGSSLYCARKLVGFVRAPLQMELLTLLDAPTRLRIQFDTFKYSIKSVLKATS